MEQKKNIDKVYRWQSFLYIDFAFNMRIVILPCFPMVFVFCFFTVQIWAHKENEKQKLPKKSNHFLWQKPLPANDFQLLRENFREAILPRHSSLAGSMIAVNKSITIGSNLDNTEINFSLPLALFSLNVMKYLPFKDLDEMRRFEKELMRTYRNILIKIFSYNPFPELSYKFYMKNPAVDFLGIKTQEQLSRNFGAGPYIYSLLYRHNKLAERNFGFSFVRRFY